MNKLKIIFSLLNIYIMSFWKKVKRGFKKFAKKTGHFLGKVGGGMQKAVKFGSKIARGITKIPILGDAVKKLAKTKIFGVTINDALKGARDLGTKIGEGLEDGGQALEDASRGNTNRLQRLGRQGLEEIQRRRAEQ